MPPRAEWSWTEAYGLMEADARDASTVRIGRQRGTPWKFVSTRRSPVSDWKTHGSALKASRNAHPKRYFNEVRGWGALERARRQRANEPQFCSGALVFNDASLSPDQLPWLELLDNGALPSRQPTDLPGAWMIQAQWRQLLEQSVRKGRGDHWLAHLHLGVMHYHARQYAAAKQAWEESLARGAFTLGLPQLGGGRQTRMLPGRGRRPAAEGARNGPGCDPIGAGMLRDAD